MERERMDMKIADSEVGRSFRKEEDTYSDKR